MANSDSSVTPEKKLLKLIEESGSKDTQTAPRRFDIKSALSPQALRGKISQAKEQAEALLQGNKKKFSLKQVITLSKISTVFIGLLLLGNVLYEVYITGAPFETGMSMAQRRIAEAAVSVSPIFSSGMPVDSDQRNVFAPLGDQVRKPSESDAISLKLVEMTQQLRLTGISVYPGDPNRTFCMIEDLQKNMTSFLRVGDTILGLQVTKITSDGITLSYEGQELEIK